MRKKIGDFNFDKYVVGATCVPLECVILMQRELNNTIIKAYDTVLRTVIFERRILAYFTLLLTTNTTIFLRKSSTLCKSKTTHDSTKITTFCSKFGTTTIATVFPLQDHRLSTAGRVR